MMPFEQRIVDTVFQPMVDRFQLDPNKACWSVFRSHAIGFATTNTLFWGLVSQNVPAGDPGMMKVYVLIALGPIMTIMIGIGMRFHDMMRLHRTDWMVRISAIAFTIADLPASILVLTAPRAPTMAKGLVVLMAVSLALTVIATYLQICRKPPPPRDREDRVRKLSFG
jgi:hypothetical protein